MNSFPRLRFPCALIVAWCASMSGAVAQSNAESGWSGALRNFGLPLGFSTEKMDPSADPRQNFNRYAAGRWLDAARIPNDTVRISAMDIQGKIVQRQLLVIAQEEARIASKASKGSPSQQVGDFYAAGMDETRLRALGVSPLKAEYARILSINDRTSLANVLARLALLANDPVVYGIEISPDTQDRHRNAVYIGDGDLPLGLDNYLSPQTQPIRDAYTTMVAQFLLLSGSSAEEAAAQAVKIVAMESRIASKKLTPVQKADPGKRFARMSYEELGQMLSNFDLAAYLSALGVPAPREVIVVDPGAVRERNVMLAEYSQADTQAYLRWELTRRAAPYLTPEFSDHSMTFNRAVYGPMEAPSRAEQVLAELPKKLGHPLSRLYVKRHFPASSKRAVEDLVGQVKAEFRRGLVRNDWLSPATRDYALTKLDRVAISVGYPTQWIDHSALEVRRDDYLGNVMRLNEFMSRRNLAKLGKPVESDQFASAGVTLPIDINAGYSPARNSIEITAAILQPPFYSAKSDIAVNLCTIGATIGHELTHGFDSQGRLYDADGNVRDWWTPDDSKNFGAQADKLVRQADATEALPGLKLNGALEVGENLADVGGTSLAWGVLERHLARHPGARRKVSGFTPQQRCILAWAQLWADKGSEGFVRQTVPKDPHPPGIYRMTAPWQHGRAFFDAFGIVPGDPMWLAPQDRVHIW